MSLNYLHSIQNLHFKEIVLVLLFHAEFICHIFSTARPAQTHVQELCLQVMLHVFLGMLMNTSPIVIKKPS